jgi:hypothetical protein
MPIERSRIIMLIIAAGSLLVGCVRVLPHQRERMAARSMQPPWPQGLAGELETKAVESKTGGGLPDNAPGGGCGCTQ